MNFKDYRPDTQTFTDNILSSIAKSIEQLLRQQKSKLISPLTSIELKELSFIITEFAEDTYFEIGMWDSIEKRNQALFGNPLPFSKPEDEEDSDFPFDEYKLAHLLWNASTIIKGYISPYHPELLPLAEKISYFLEKKFKKVKGPSSVKKFLAAPHKTGVDVKKKLVWLAQKSYLFRFLCQEYLEKEDAQTLSFKEKIPYWDDFICQECTIWAGMGVLDVAVDILKLTATQKIEISSWYERHFAYYEVLEVNGKNIVAKNLVIDKIYEICNPTFRDYQVGTVIRGSLVPFDGIWYWSGLSSDMGSVNLEDLKWLIANLRKQSPQIVYRYDKKGLEKAIERLKEYHTSFLEYFGGDLVAFETGEQAAKAAIEKMKYQQSKILGAEAYLRQEIIFDSMEKNIEKSHPQDFLDAKGGVCMFFNPSISREMVSHFDKIKSAFNKKGNNLSIEDGDTIHDLINSSSVSAALIQRLVKEYGAASIAVAFRLPNPPTYWFDYLLRKYKGKDYRTNYPRLSVLTNEETELLKSRNT